MSLRKATVKARDMSIDDDPSKFSIKDLQRTDRDSKVGSLIENNTKEESHSSKNQVQILEIQRNDIKFCM